MWTSINWLIDSFPISSHASSAYQRRTHELGRIHDSGDELGLTLMRSKENSLSAVWTGNLWAEPIRMPRNMRYYFLAVHHGDRISQLSSALSKKPTDMSRWIRILILLDQLDMRVVVSFYNTIVGIALTKLSAKELVGQTRSSRDPPTASPEQSQDDSHSGAFLIRVKFETRSTKMTTTIDMIRYRAFTRYSLFTPHHAMEI